MSKATPHDSSGTTLTFPGLTADVTQITYNKDPRGMIDTTHLGLGSTAYTRQQKAPLKSPSTVSIDYIGSGSIANGSTGSLSISGGVSVSGSATVVSNSLTLAVNDVIRGSVEFQVED